jgi:TPR repeat protein
LDLDAEKLAATCFESAASSGCLPAKRGLARCYWEGRGVESDLKKAEVLYREAAASGNLDDQRALMFFLDRVNRGSEFEELRDQVAQMEKMRDSRVQWTELQRMSH